MASTETRITLVVPGLLGPLSNHPESEDDPAWPRVPALEWLLAHSRAGKDPVTSLDDWVCTHFGVPAAGERDWPVAPLLADLELQEPIEGYWLRADPVHLRADRSCLRLFGPDVLEIQEQEAHALADSINALYGPDGWRLVVAAPQRWYLRLPETPHIETTPLTRVLGRDIDPFLPRGPQGPLWHGLMNEIQMLFHTHAVNDARNDAGRPTINSLWFWGGGLRPEFSHPRFDRIITDDLLTRALGKSTNIPVFNVSTLPDSLDALEEGHTLVVWHKCALALQEGSWEPWCQAHASLEQQCWQPLQQRIQSKTLTSLILHPLSGTHYQWPGGPWWRAWRRKPLSRYLPS